MEQLSFDIVPTSLAVEAMRDNGYKNAAYAIAELMDNAIQAGARRVELLCCNEQHTIVERIRRRIKKVAVLDNGSGMDAKTLRMALQFGNGTRLGDRTGMGRFGMGLPSASISQARRVDVWSWQQGPEGALHSYIDVGEINEGKMKEVPEPKPHPIPSVWMEVGTVGEAGTLVVWSQIDRCIWKQAVTIIRNSESLIGRMYRKFLHGGQVEIRMVEFVEGFADDRIEKMAEINDPGYLLAPSSTPNPYDSQPMFERYGEHWEVKIDVENEDGDTHPVYIRFSHATKEARTGPNPGNRPYGRHAAKNVGVSVVRAGRELELNQSWVIQYDPTERWWGVEVEFHPALDELFGVANNKQSARYFSDLGKLDIEELLNGRTMAQLKEEMKAEGDPLWPLLETAHVIKNNLANIRNILRMQRRGERTRRRFELDPNSPEAQATEVTERRKQEGFFGSSDEEESLPTDERVKAIEDQLISQDVEPESARGLAVAAVDNNLKYVLTEAQLESAAFFTVRPKGGAVVVTLNINHPAHEHLLEVLEEVEEGETEEALRDRLTNALRGLKLLLLAWARYEDEQPEGMRRDSATDARADWGRMAKQFLRTSQ